MQPSRCRMIARSASGTAAQVLSRRADTKNLGLLVIGRSCPRSIIALRSAIPPCERPSKKSFSSVNSPILHAATSRRSLPAVSRHQTEHIGSSALKLRLPRGNLIRWTSNCSQAAPMSIALHAHATFHLKPYISPLSHISPIHHTPLHTPLPLPPGRLEDRLKVRDFKRRTTTHRLTLAQAHLCERVRPSHIIGNYPVVARPNGHSLHTA